MRRFAFFCLFVLAVPVAFSQEQRPDALALYRTKKYAEAAEVCRAEITENDRNLDSYVVLCWSLLAQEKYDEAENWAEKGRQLSKYDPRLLEALGESFYFRGMNADALKFFQDYIAYAVNGSAIGDVYYFMGEIYVRQGKYNHADIAFSYALQHKPRNAAWMCRMGYAREMAKDYKYSLEAYRSALEIDASFTDAILGRDRVLKAAR